MNDAKDILQATLEIAQKVGWEKVSVRGISKEIGYSTIKIYSDFGSKEELLFKIQQRGFAILRTAYTKATEQFDLPEEMLESIALVHIRFALQHPMYYELMFDYKFNSCKSKSAKTKREVGNIIYEVIQQITQVNSRIAFLQFYAMLYGFIQITKDFPHKKDFDMEATTIQFVRNFINGIR
ncbi:MAG: TetR/AcrR family transcriptional regulator [Bacteroidota bacterium]